MKDSKYKSLFILVIILLVGLVGTSGYIVYEKLFKTDNEIVNNSNQNDDKPSEKISLTDFDLSFLKMENAKKNMLYSPLSIKYALKMLLDGAKGNTKAQIEDVLKDTKVTKYDNIDQVLSLANGIFIRDSFAKDVKPEYINNLKTNYNAEVKYDPFKSVTNMNNWIEDKTLGIIKDMLKPDAITPNTEVVLINALAIIMDWHNQFDFKDTRGLDFYLENGKKITATTMNKETFGKDVSYYKDDQITALNLDLKKYDNVELEFMAIMPHKNLEQYLKDLKISDIQNITMKLKPASEVKNGVNVYIPKFKFTYDLDFKTDLQKLGITDAFTDAADFTNMTYQDLLHVAKALHKADIDFSEKGIKAAAATVIIFNKSAVDLPNSKSIEIKIDKPFLFVIKDKNTNELWFIGTVYEPNLWENDKALYKSNH